MAIPTTLTCMVYGRERNEIQEIFRSIDLGEEGEIKVTHVRMKLKIGDERREEKKGERRTKPKKGDRSGKGVDAFSNQTTIEILLTDEEGERKINLMCFATSIKMVGCRSIEDGIKVVSWFKGKFPPNEYTIEPVMQNMKLSLSKRIEKKMKIDREKLNLLFNREFQEKDAFSQFEPALYPNVMVIFSFSPLERKILKIGEEVEEVFEGSKKDRKIEAKLKIYESGQVVITGTNLDVCQRSIDQFLTFFEDNLEELIIQ